MKFYFFAFILCIFMSTTSNAANFIGTYCVTLNVQGQEIEAFELAVSSVDAGNYQINGTHTNPSTTAIGSVIGNAAIVNNTIQMTLRESHADQSGLSMSTYHMNLDSSTLRGDFKNIAQDYSSEFEPLSYIEGTALLDVCQN